jgi:hypothetical protein
MSSGKSAETPRNPECDPHPDPTIESMLRVLRLSAHALARCGAADWARVSFHQAITVGERAGPPPPAPTGDDA